MFRDARIHVVIPAYNVADHIADVIKSLPAWVDAITGGDDGGARPPAGAGRCDYTKGNRFLFDRELSVMPKHRLAGNFVLTFLTKLASGYWNVFDPQNGDHAIP